MNSDSYNLDDAYVAVGGAGLQETVNDFADKVIGDHRTLALGLIIVLSLAVIWWIVRWSKESFNPTQNMRNQDSDQFGFGAKEHMAAAPSAFAQMTQDGSYVPLTIDPNAKAGQPGSAAYQVLHSADYACANRSQSPSDAWSWMNGVAHENMTAGGPRNDNQFSKVLSGQ